MKAITANFSARGKFGRFYDSEFAVSRDHAPIVILFHG